jgi:hypothetical protein
LEGRARERYNRLAQLSPKRGWYQEQYDTLDALVETLRTDNRWLEYRLQVVRDELLDQGAQTVEGSSMVDQVKATLLERDEALRKTHKDLATMRTMAVELETEVASTRAQLQ